MDSEYTCNWHSSTSHHKFWVKVTVHITTLNNSKFYYCYKGLKNRFLFFIFNKFLSVWKPPWPKQGDQGFEILIIAWCSFVLRLVWTSDSDSRCPRRWKIHKQTPNDFPLDSWGLHNSDWASLRAFSSCTVCSDFLESSRIFGLDNVDDVVLSVITGSRFRLQKKVAVISNRTFPSLICIQVQIQNTSRTFYAGQIPVSPS